MGVNVVFAAGAAVEPCLLLGVPQRRLACVEQRPAHDAASKQDGCAV